MLLIRKGHNICNWLQVIGPVFSRSTGDYLLEYIYCLLFQYMSYFVLNCQYYFSLLQYGHVISRHPSPQQEQLTMLSGEAVSIRMRFVINFDSLHTSLNRHCKHRPFQERCAVVRAHTHTSKNFQKCDKSLAQIKLLVICFYYIIICV